MKRKVEVTINVNCASQETTDEVLCGVQEFLDSLAFIDLEKQTEDLQSEVNIRMYKNE